MNTEPPVLDRRMEPQISIAVLEHMEARLTAHHTTILKTLDVHTEEEMERYNQILSLIAQSNTDHNERHKSLLISVDNHMAKTSQIYASLCEAFPVDKKGNPDFRGHAMAHEAWIESAAATKELMEYIKKAIIVSMLLAFGSWMGMLVWQGFLHGPR